MSFPDTAAGKLCRLLQNDAKLRCREGKQVNVAESKTYDDKVKRPFDPNIIHMHVRQLRMPNLNTCGSCLF